MAGPSDRDGAKAGEDRRTHRRVSAVVYCRPAGVDYFATRLDPVDISLGGMRVQSDEALSAGAVLRLDVFARGVPPVTCSAQVVWSKRLPAAPGARFEAGLQFIQLSGAALEAVTLVLAASADYADEAAPASRAQRTVGLQGRASTNEEVPESEVRPATRKPPPS